MVPYTDQETSGLPIMMVKVAVEQLIVLMMTASHTEPLTLGSFLANSHSDYDKTYKS